MRPIRNCAKAIIVRDESILTVKYSDEGGESYALPGGGQLHGETLPVTLLRECREELGVAVVSLGLRFIREYIGKEGDSRWRDADVHQVEFLYECALEPDQEPQLGRHRDHSQVDIAWLPIRNLWQYRFYPKALVTYLRSPFPGRTSTGEVSSESQLHDPVAWPFPAVDRAFVARLGKACCVCSEREVALVTRHLRRDYDRPT